MNCADRAEIEENTHCQMTAMQVRDEKSDCKFEFSDPKNPERPNSKG